MHDSLLRMRRSQDGFTLIEIIVVVAILGILAAILVPTVTGLLSEGDETALNADVEITGLAVAEFKLDRHVGPDGTPEWGADGTGAKRLFPTNTGLVGDLELNPATTDADFVSNLIVSTYVPGPSFGAPANASDVQDAMVWMGLIVNEPFTQSGAPQQTTGDARPKTNEDGQYIPDFPASAHSDNTAADPSGSRTNGTYHFVVLQTGDVVAVYQGGDSNWYAGFNDVYP